jgi:hypothetical protein
MTTTATIAVVIMLLSLESSERVVEYMNMILSQLKPKKNKHQ